MNIEIIKIKFICIFAATLNSHRWSEIIFLFIMNTKIHTSKGKRVQKENGKCANKSSFTICLINVVEWKEGDDDKIFLIKFICDDDDKFE